MKISIKYDMGEILKDIVTGFEGPVLGITLYATGCTHYGLSSQKVQEDGSISDWNWFDESRVISTERQIVLNPKVPETPSGPEKNPPQW